MAKSCGYCNHDAAAVVVSANEPTRVYLYCHACFMRSKAGLFGGFFTYDIFILKANLWSIVSMWRKPPRTVRIMKAFPEPEPEIREAAIREAAIHEAVSHEAKRVLRLCIHASWEDVLKRFPKNFRDSTRNPQNVLESLLTRAIKQTSGELAAVSQLPPRVINWKKKTDELEEKLRMQLVALKSEVRELRRERGTLRKLSALKKEVQSERDELARLKEEALLLMNARVAAMRLNIGPEFPPVPPPACVVSRDPTLPEACGVYFVWGADAVVVYVGESLNLARRVTLLHGRIYEGERASWLLCSPVQRWWWEQFYILTCRPLRNLPRRYAPEGWFRNDLETRVQSIRSTGTSGGDSSKEYVHP